jgi:hypothetical protein
MQIFILGLDIPTCVGILHLFGMVIENIYGFVITKNVLFDKLYVISFISIPFSWIICKDECIISYLVKKYENPKYILGSEPDNSNDITDLFPNKTIYSGFHITNHFLRIASLAIVNHRTVHASGWVFSPTMILYSFYVYDIIYKLNFRKLMYPYFHVVLCMYLFTIFYNVTTSNSV